MSKPSTIKKAPKTTKTKPSGVEWLGDIPYPTVVRSPLQGSDVVDATIPRALPWAVIDYTIGVAPSSELIAINSINNATIKNRFIVQIETNPVIKKFLIAATHPHNHQIPIDNQNSPSSPCTSSSLISPNGANYTSLGQCSRSLTTPTPAALKERQFQRPKGANYTSLGQSPRLLSTHVLVALKGRPNQHFHKKQGGDHE